MGYLQCFLPPSLISTIATNTNLFATFKQAPAGWATTPEEVWSFVTVNIFMGIIKLPYLHMYWEGSGGSNTSSTPSPATVSRTSSATST